MFLTYLLYKGAKYIAQKQVLKVKFPPAVFPYSYQKRHFPNNFAATSADSHVRRGPDPPPTRQAATTTAAAAAIRRRRPSSLGCSHQREAKGTGITVFFENILLFLILSLCKQRGKKATAAEERKKAAAAADGGGAGWRVKLVRRKLSFKKINFPCNFDQKNRIFQDLLRAAWLRGHRDHPQGGGLQGGAAACGLQGARAGGGDFPTIKKKKY